jgi:hypothetical protein
LSSRRGTVPRLFFGVVLCELARKVGLGELRAH